MRGLALVLLLVPALASAQDYGGYRPHYQGPGSSASGGRGGSVLRVTNLNDSGAGSLRAALIPGSCAPRFVVFEVSGKIDTTGGYAVTCPDLTVAGQTAPAPGITVYGGPIVIDTDNVVLQHFRVRLGDSTGYTYAAKNQSAVIWIRNDAQNVVLDHLSASWGTSTSISVSQLGVNWDEIAILDCLISEGLNEDISEQGAAVLFNQSINGDAVVARNLTVSMAHRNIPIVVPGARMAVLNNITYNPTNLAGIGFSNLQADGYTTTSPSQAAWAWEVVRINNRAVAGPNTHASGKALDISLSAAQKAANVYRLYQSGNVGPGGSDWASTIFNGVVQADVDYVTAPSWYTTTAYEVLAAGDVHASVIANAGARPSERADAGTRDATDYRVVGYADASAGGSHLTTQTTVAEWPLSIAANTQTYTTPAGANDVDPGRGSPFTVIEADLEDKACALEPSCDGPPDPVIPPVQYRLPRILRPAEDQQ